MSNSFAFNIPDSLKRNTPSNSTNGFSLPPPPNPPSRAGAPPAFTNVFNRSTFSKTYPTVKLPSNEGPPTRLFANQSNSKNSFGAQSNGSNGNGRPNFAIPSNGSAMGLSQNSKMQLLTAMGEKFQKPSLDSLFNKKPAFSSGPMTNQQPSTSFEGFGGPRAKGTSTGFTFRHPTPSAAATTMRNTPPKPNSLSTPRTKKQPKVVGKLEDRMNRSGNAWAELIKSEAASPLSASVSSSSESKFKPGRMRSQQQPQQQKMIRPQLAQKSMMPSFRSQPANKEDVAHQLRSLIGTLCQNSEEKYMLLKKRDELMYKTRVKNTDVSVMNAVQAKCLDMCPEKERYMREYQKNLNRYECDASGRMVPALMVKDYSRSAADQEEPLPHELRPSNVLQMSMNYLFNNIASEMPSNASDLAKWYDFLWSRTRSIRKDITQQMLTDKTAVDMVEKCARLHVFASFRLVSLDIAEFNQKMNSENLSKSLQTLRHMYEDLAAEGIFCDNEAEFRSYDIILNLSDSNVHSQVLSYRDEVRTSSEVQLALILAASLQSNNYVQFFRQLKSRATFLQSCLCQRYFSLVRYSALQTICYAYRMFPQEKFTEILAFDSGNDATNFLSAFGIEMDAAEDSYIDVSEGKASFGPDGSAPNPESLPVGRCAWLEQKIGSKSLPEVLCNGPSGKMQLQEPVDSFDSEGRYTKDPFNSDAEWKPVEREENNARHRIEEQTRRAAEEQSRKAAEERSRRLSEEQAKRSAEEREQRALQERARQLAEEQAMKVAEERARQMAEEQARRRAAEEHVRLVAAEQARHAAEEQARRTKEEEARRKEQQLALQKANQLKAAVSQFVHTQVEQMLEWAVLRELETLASSVKSEATRFQERLDKFRDNLFKMWLRQFTDRWKNVVKRNKLLRSIAMRQEEGITGEKARRSIRSLCSSDGSQSPQRKKRKRITADQMELRLLARHFNASRAHYLAKHYFTKWRRITECRKRIAYFEGFCMPSTASTSFCEGLYEKARRYR